MRPESPISDDVLRQALDAAPDGIVVVDETGTIVFVNPMAEQLFEYPRDELVGMSVDALLPDATRGTHAGRRAEYGAHPRARSMGSGLDLHGRRRSGTAFPLEISLSPLRTGGELLVIAIVRDVTDRRAADKELQRGRDALALVDDRERIARDLHDTVIQRLFAVGLSLQSALSRAVSPAVIERIQLSIDEIDVTIRDIRASIFALHTRRPFGESLRDDVLVIAREAARALGFEPSVAFDGPVDTVVTDRVREHLLATLREALSNVTRHAHASAATIKVVIDGREVVLRVDDDGVGFDGDGVGNGLRNMKERAVTSGGGCEIVASATGRGTQIIWHVPVGNGPD
jgi:two-component system, NarL family, sensor histidine kinase DevS